ncbi:hypothetical protein DRB96_03880 [Streptomyces sp. ICC1]|nr:hypothetical protein DRB96_03880 [Streptomyces sp. ICC1]
MHPRDHSREPVAPDRKRTPSPHPWLDVDIHSQARTRRSRRRRGGVSTAARTASSTWSSAPTACTPTPGHWSKGRTALVGDSAYCASSASGQGTSLALLGAYVLARELAAASGDHRTGFA